jgi:hypothetical protein
LLDEAFTLEIKTEETFAQNPEPDDDDLCSPSVGIVFDSWLLMRPIHASLDRDVVARGTHRTPLSDIPSSERTRLAQQTRARNGGWDWKCYRLRAPSQPDEV